MDKSAGGLDTRQRLLHAAEQIFAAKGFDGSRVGEIAARAGVNIRMLYHHFGSKEGLFYAVLEDLNEALHREQREIYTTGGDPRETLRRSLEAGFNYLKNNPNYIRITGWNMLVGDRVKDSRKMGREFVSQFMRPQVEKIKSGPGWNDQVDPLHALVHIWGMIFIWFLNREEFHELFGGGDPDEQDRQYLDQLNRLLENGM